MTVINPPEKKLANRTSVDRSTARDFTVFVIFFVDGSVPLTLVKNLTDNSIL